MYYSHTQARSKLPKKRRRVLPVETVRQQTRTNPVYSNNGEVGSGGLNGTDRHKLGVITSIVQKNNNHHEEHMMTKRNPISKSASATSNAKLVESTNTASNNHNNNIKISKY
jgi:hypothetical protein